MLSRRDNSARVQRAASVRGKTLRQVETCACTAHDPSPRDEFHLVGQWSFIPYSAA
jgi:hypothetical protein